MLAYDIIKQVVMQLNKYPYRDCYGRWLRIVIPLLSVIGINSFSVQNGILSKYQPLAMDESVHFEGSEASRSDIGSERFSRLDGDRVSAPRFANEDLIPPDGSSKGLLNLDSLGLTPKLTKLITQPEEKAPTFFNPKPVQPVLRVDSNKREGSKVLATYNFMIPLLIPAVKKRIEPEAESRMVKEVVTEMVPIKSNVPVVQEVYRAERVPQKVVTDFVKARNQEVPETIDDNLQPGEQVVATEVKEYA